MNLDCSICGKTSFTYIDGLPVCEDCFYSMQENDFSTIQDNVKKFRGKLTFERIERIVCNYYKINPKSLGLKTRKREVVITRQLCHFFSMENKLGSLKTVGLRFGQKDHATVLHSCKTIDNLRETDKSFRKKFEEIKFEIDNKN